MEAAVTIGLDLGKSVFQVHGVNRDGVVVVQRRFTRARLLAFFAKQPGCLVGMEACAAAHHWARELQKLGRRPKLMPPRYVKPYVKRQKNDAADAEAICEAVGRPNMRFVPIKTREQQAVLALHRVRALLVRQRTATINALRGLLTEFGVVAGKGTQRISDLNERMGKLSAEVLPDEGREALTCLFNQIDDLGLRIHAVERRIIAWHRASEASQRLASAPGVGPITATALVAAVGDGTQFKSARHFAAWLGLTPRVRASGEKERIGRITKGGDRYLRTLLIHGARAVVGTTFRKGVTVRPWLAALVNRRPVNVAATAVAHKTARALWAMLTRCEAYRRSAGLSAAA